MEIVLASHNKKKIAELESFLSDMLGGEKILTAGEVGVPISRRTALRSRKMHLSRLVPFGKAAGLRSLTIRGFA